MLRLRLAPPRWSPQLILAGLLLLAILALRNPADSTGLTRLDQAEATLAPDGRPVETRQVSLRHRWERDFPGLGGKAHYRLQLPPAPAHEPMAVQLGHSGNQLEIRLNGQLLERIGTPGDRRTDALKGSHVLRIPAPLLHAGPDNLLEIDATIQALRAAGLGTVHFGPLSDIDTRHARDELWSRDLPRIYAVSLALIGTLSLALWHRQADPLYGSFSIAALSGFVRVYDQTLILPPLPWPAWGAVVAVCYSLHLCFVAQFVLQALGKPPRWLVRGIHSILLTVLMLIAASFGLGQPQLWTVALGLLMVVGLACYGHVLHQLQQTSSPIARLLSVAGAAAIACGGHDLIQVRMGIGNGAPYPLMPHAVFFFVLILSGIVVDRYGRSIAAVHDLNASLASRIGERERQLTAALATLHREREAQALAEERQRIMRELHDGIGSQLVGLLNLLDRKVTDLPTLSEHVRVALDEMRIAVDSLQPLDHDLTALLANLRYRLQPRLAAAGLKVAWDVPYLPSHTQLTPQSALHLQRILLEAFTNTLKHAQASTISLHADVGGYPEAIRISVEDDGIGRPDHADPGGAHGLGTHNMRTRATMIGAHLDICQRPGGGTRILIEWPISTSTPHPTSNTAPPSATPQI